ncbi:fimbrial protein, partial [Salmonella enterica]|nr:fimbrial protein [Salmonella enterica]
KEVVIPVNHPIPVLAIRTQTKEPFHGDAEFAPQIDFHDALDINNFFDSAVAPVVLDVKTQDGKQIGVMYFNMLAVGVSSYKTPDQGGANTVMIAPNAGDGFYGGLGKSLKKADGLIPRIQNIFGSELAANYTDQGTGSRAPARETFDDKNATFSGYYGAGIEAGQSIKLVLDREAAGNEPIKWHASLPVTVSYP